MKRWRDGSASNSAGALQAQRGVSSEAGKAPLLEEAQDTYGVTGLGPDMEAASKAAVNGYIVVDARLALQWVLREPYTEVRPGGG